jgi:hypothetical protein
VYIVVYTYSMNNYELTKNFNLEEFKVSDSYPELAGKIKFTATDLLIIKLLCVGALQPIRDVFGPMKILSGKRSPELNEKVGGSTTSDHLIASACDITPTKLKDSENLETVFNWIIKTKSVMSLIRQIILYPKQNFIHLSINTPFKTIRNDKLVNHDGSVWVYDNFETESQKDTENGVLKKRPYVKSKGRKKNKLNDNGNGNSEV